MGVSDDYRDGVYDLYLLNALVTIAYVSVWYAYLSRSRRVRATYFMDEEETTD
jgi:hypothetical protein